MNPIQDLADRVAEGSILEGARQAILVLRDGEAGCDWVGTGGCEPEASRRAELPFRSEAGLRVVTTAAVLRACELHLTGLDKSIANHLDPDLVAGLCSDRGCGGDITIRDLLDRSDAVELNTPGSGSAAAQVPQRGVGLFVAGLVLEDATGLTLHDALRELVLGPAGMDAGFVDGHLVTTAADLASLMTKLVGGSLVNVDSWAEMTTWLEEPAAPHDGRGLGLVRYRIGAHEVIGQHSSDGDIVFALPFGVVLAGTFDTACSDPQPLLEALLGALC